ncbi:MAG: FAD-dependent oxidoreductase, partial [Deltaproteobacteria bacterium]|nr:FAD-dependent oxidoreductase [Deltaproteobacteria bacterium]
KPDTLQAQAELFLNDFDTAMPGMKAAATTVDGKYRVQRGHWESQQYSKGSYTANGPGYFTTIAGLEAEPVGALKFAGEHADSFYSWQGYMEGACLSGISAAGQVLGDIKDGKIV